MYNNTDHGPHWRIKTIPVSADNPPTWATFCLPASKLSKIAPHPVNSYSAVMEIGVGSGEEFPYFAAPLSPERNLLHYLISELMCNASIENKKFLETQINRLYTKQNRDKVNADYESQRAEFESDIEICRKIAERFFESQKPAIPDSLMPVFDEHSVYPTPDGMKRIMGISRFAEERITSKKATPNTFQRFVLAELEKLYHQLEASMNSKHKDYVPGCFETGGLDDLKKIFVAAFVNRLIKAQSEDVARRVARDIVAEEIAQERLGFLPFLPAEKCHHTIISGVMAAGKTVLLKQLERQGKIDRKQCVTIDIDEFRDLEEIIKPSARSGTGAASWANQAHQECHMIRRKILDTLEGQASEGIYRNVVLMTSFLSPRIRRWLTEGNPNVNMYMMYCAPEKALMNAHHRSQIDGRQLSTERVLDSVRDLAVTLRFMLGVEIGTGNNLKFQVIDTSNAAFSGPDDAPVMTGENIVLTADDTNGVQIKDLAACEAVYRGYYLNPKAENPGALYNSSAEAEAHKKMRATLKPHSATIHLPDGRALPKAPGELTLQGITPAQLLANPMLNDIFGKQAKTQSRSV